MAMQPRPLYPADQAAAVVEDAEFIPWEKQECDTQLGWKAFQAYRDLGLDRSLNAAAKAAGISHSAVSHASMRCDWAGRVHAYDRHQDKIVREAVERERVTAARSYASVAKIMREKAQRAILEMPADMFRKNPTCITTFIKTAAEIEFRLLSIREHPDLEKPVAEEPATAFLDNRPLEELIPLAERALENMRAQLARQQAVAKDKLLEGKADGNA